MGIVDAAKKDNGADWLDENDPSLKGFCFSLSDETGKELFSNGDVKKNADNGDLSYKYQINETLYDNGERGFQIIGLQFRLLGKLDMTETDYIWTEGTTVPEDAAVPEPTARPDTTETEAEPTTEEATEAVTEPAQPITTEPTTEPATEPAAEPVTVAMQEPPTQAANPAGASAHKNAAAVPPETTAPAGKPEKASDIQNPDEEESAPGNEPENETLHIPYDPNYSYTAIEEGCSDIYIQDERIKGIATVFVYVCPEDTEPVQEIYDHCYQLYQTVRGVQEAHYEGNYEIYYQDEFDLSANGVPYFIGTRHSDREIEGLYDGGPDYDDRKPVRRNIYLLNLTFDRAQAETIGGIYPQLLRFADAADGYLDHLTALTVLFAALGAINLAFMLWGAGYTRAQEAPKAGGIHRLPIDVILVCALIIGGFLLEIALPWMFSLIVILLMALALLETFTVHLRAKMLFSGLVIVRLIRWIKKLIRYADGHMQLFWKAAAVYIAIGVLGFISNLLFWHSPFIHMMLFLLSMVGLLAGMAVLVNNFSILKKGAKDISQGQYHPIKCRPDYGEFKEFSDSLNNISGGFNSAVEARMKSERTKTELITNVSHDLKTPLTSIVNYVDLLKKEPIDNEKAKEYIEVLDRQAARLKKLTDDIVDASKAAAGSVKTDIRPMAVNILLSQICGEYEERLQNRNLTAVTEIPEEELTVLADGQLLWRVFDNLMNNICKYAMPNTRVYLRAAKENGSVDVVFRNISEQALNIDPAELTDRFVRGDAARNTDGSGLGLYIAKSLTEAMGGKMWINIDGDLFKVTLRFREANAQ